jgi:DNA-binding GntR family transcriptional regulator
MRHLSEADRRLLTQADAQNTYGRLGPPASADRLSEEVANRMRNAILTGELRPGERLVEGAIAEALGVSKSPVREAIRELARQGLIVATKRKGAYIREMTEKDLRDIRILRVTLEGLAVRLSMEEPDASWVDNLESTAKMMNEAEDQSKLNELHLAFHGLLTSRSGNERLSEMLANLLTQTAAVLPFVDLVSGGAATYAEEHIAIVGALKSGDTERAVAIVADHISGSGELLEAYWRRRAPAAEHRGIL